MINQNRNNLSKSYNISCVINSKHLKQIKKEEDFSENNILPSNNHMS